MEINRTNLRTFRADFEQAMTDLQTKWGVKIDMKNISFDNTHFTFKTEVTNTNLAPGQLSKDQTEWNRNAWLYNLRPEDFGRTVTLSRGTTAVITGLATRSRQYPILVKSNGDGKTYKMNADAVRRELDKNYPAAANTVAPQVQSAIDLVAKTDLSNITIETLTATSKGMIAKPSDKLSRKEQVQYFMQKGLTSASEIAGLLGTNASYVNRLMK